MNELIHGQALEEVWSSLSADARNDITDQVVCFLKGVRGLTSDLISCVDRGPCYPGLLFFDFEPRASFHSGLDLWQAARKHLQH